MLELTLSINVDLTQIISTPQPSNIETSEAANMTMVTCDIIIRLSLINMFPLVLSVELKLSEKCQCKSVK